MLSHHYTKNNTYSNGESQTGNQYSTSTTTSIQMDSRELPCYLSVSVGEDEGKTRSHSEPQQVPGRVEEWWGDLVRWGGEVVDLPRIKEQPWMCNQTYRCELQTVTILLICFLVSPCGLAGVCWVTVNICGPAVRRATLLTKPVWQVSLELWRYWLHAMSQPVNDRGQM